MTLQSRKNNCILDLLWILPNLNEKIDVVRNNLLKCFNYAKTKNYKSKIILSDGGSSIKFLYTLKKFIQNLNTQNISTQIMLCLPAMRPNKNLSILNIVERYKSRYVIILDSDLLSLDRKTFENLTNPLKEGEAKMVLPNIKRKSGRSNHLVINPLLRLFYPEIAQRANFVLSGILGIDYSYLRKIVTSPNYCWDWGGEIQIICKGFEYSKDSVKTFIHKRRDAKRRKLSSKMEEARQIFRTLLYEILKKGNLNETFLNKRLKSSWLNNRILVKKFLEWQKTKNVNIAFNLIDLDSRFNQFLNFCSKDPKWFSFYLDEIYKKTGAYEILIFKNIVLDTILRTLFQSQLNYHLKEIRVEKFEKIDLESISMFADIVFTVYISLWFNQIKKPKNFQYFLNLLSPQDTDFINVNKLTDFRKSGLCSVDINSIDKLKEIIKVYNDLRIPLFEKNRLIFKMLKI